MSILSKIFSLYLFNIIFYFYCFINVFLYLDVKKCWCHQSQWPTVSNIIKQLRTLELRTYRNIVLRSFQITGFVINLYTVSNLTVHNIWFLIVKLYFSAWSEDWRFYSHECSFVIWNVQIKVGLPTAFSNSSPSGGCGVSLCYWV